MSLGTSGTSDSILANFGNSLESQTGLPGGNMPNRGQVPTGNNNFSGTQVAATAPTNTNPTTPAGTAPTPQPVLSNPALAGLGKAGMPNIGAGKSGAGPNMTTPVSTQQNNQIQQQTGMTHPISPLPVAQPTLPSTTNGVVNSIGPKPIMPNMPMMGAGGTVATIGGNLQLGTGPVAPR
jgi:hypothetical protein